MQSFLSKSLFSKILAREDIRFRISKEAKTASFNYRNRELTLPDWDTSEELERLLISHEVAHALFTDPIKRTAFIEEYPEDFRKYAARALNFIEDARIEKLIMRKYPGLTKDYISGYRELVDVFNFFKSPYYTNIFDKLNHHFKLVVSGQQDDIYSFDSVEEDIVNRMLSLETYDDTIELTREMIELYGDQIQLSDCSSTFFSSLDGEIDVDIEEEVEIETKIEQDQDIQHPQNLENYTLNSVNTSRYIGNNYRKGSGTYESTSKIVQYMYGLFKKKMNARSYSTQIRRKTGDIDPNTLYRYRYDEKIFASKTIKEKQKNHSVVMLVDGSGSMADSMKAVALQAKNMAEFCKLAKIPFRCFVFQDINGTVITGFPSQSRVKLNEFFSEGSNFSVETASMSKMASGSTPLSEALVSLLGLVEEMNSKYDVVNFMVVTDGQCNNNNTVIQNMRYKNTYITASELNKNDRASVPTSLFRVYRDYYGVNVISFDLGNHSCYNSYYNSFGVDIHFEVPLDFVQDVINSKKFLDELVSIISK